VNCCISTQPRSRLAWTDEGWGNARLAFRDTDVIDFPDLPDGNLKRDRLCLSEECHWSVQQRICRTTTSRYKADMTVYTIAAREKTRPPSLHARPETTRKWSWRGCSILGLKHYRRVASQYRLGGQALQSGWSSDGQPRALQHLASRR
jgi:hypothetical protein